MIPPIAGSRNSQSRHGRRGATVTEPPRSLDSHPSPIVLTQPLARAASLPGTGAGRHSRVSSMLQALPDLKHGLYSVVRPDAFRWKLLREGAAGGCDWDPKNPSLPQEIQDRHPWSPRGSRHLSFSQQHHNHDRYRMIRRRWEVSFRKVAIIFPPLENAALRASQPCLLGRLHLRKRPNPSRSFAVHLARWTGLERHREVPHATPSHGT